MAPFTNSVERCQPFFFMLSTGYTLAAIAFFPLGKFILAASHTNAFEAAHATSLAFWILNFHVQLALLGREFLSLISLSLLIIIVLSLLFAWFQRLIWSAVKQSCGFCNSPEPATIRFAGAVTLDSISPYSR